MHDGWTVCTAAEGDASSSGERELFTSIIRATASEYLIPVTRLAL